MKNFFKVMLVLVVGFVLAGCWDKESKEIGGGTNQNKTGMEKMLSEKDLTEAYGEVIHHGVPVTKLFVQGLDMGESLSALNIADKSKNPEIFSLICDSRAGAWGVTHTFLDENGQPATQGVDVSIMNYRAGLTNIREVDERGVVYSSADGDYDIVKGLKKIATLDPDSTIAFVIDKPDANGETVGYAWSRLIKVSDLVEELKKVNLSNCAKAASQGEGAPEIEYHSFEELRQMAAKARQ